MNLHKTAVGFLQHLIGLSKRKAVHRRLARLERAIAMRFSDPGLLMKALTHTSALPPGSDDTEGSNERLEFLGDAVINCCVVEHLYRRYPGQSEGQLTKIKSLIVSRKILGEIGYSIGLEEFLVLGSSERESVGRSRHTIVSNAFEALVGAMYIDKNGNLESVKHLLGLLLFPRIDEFLSETSNINYKSRILELSQRDGFGIPRYTVVETTGPEHEKTFRVQVSIAGRMMGEGSGPNKKMAEQEAAKSALFIYDSEQVSDQSTDHNKGAGNDELVSD